jgi:hypothetical protein
MPLSAYNSVILLWNKSDELLSRLNCPFEMHSVETAENIAILVVGSDLKMQLVVHSDLVEARVYRYPMDIGNTNLNVKSGP